MADRYGPPTRAQRIAGRCVVALKVLFVVLMYLFG
jgi:hypothetical protein